MSREIFSLLDSSERQENSLFQRLDLLLSPFKIVAIVKFHVETTSVSFEPGIDSLPLMENVQFAVNRFLHHLAVECLYQLIDLDSSIWLLQTF